MGTIHPLGEGSGFTYDREWSTLPWVSLTMPPRTKSWIRERGLLPVFDMNFPEGYQLEELRSRLSRRYGRIDDFFIFGYLAGAARGRIEYACPWFEGTDAEPGEMRLADVLDSRDPELPRALWDRFISRSFAAGIQPKVLARLSGASPYASREYIIKTWGEKYPYLADNEFFCMTAARRAGILTPYFAVSEDSRFLVVERFDVDAYGDVRGFEELCALEGKTSSDKYSGSYEQAARTVAMFTNDESVIASLENFFSMLCLSMLVRNGNAHLKNFGILYDSEKEARELAPCYDLVTTSAYDSGEVPALSLNGRRTWPTEKELVNFGVSACNLDKKRARELRDVCAQAVADTRKDVRARALGLPGFGPVADRMLVAWEVGLGDRSGE